MFEVKYLWRQFILEEHLFQCVTTLKLGRCDDLVLSLILCYLFVLINTYLKKLVLLIYLPIWIMNSQYIADNKLAHIQEIISKNHLDFLTISQTGKWNNYTCAVKRLQQIVVCFLLFPTIFTRQRSIQERRDKLS